jgi:hypothetical protein
MRRTVYVPEEVVREGLDFPEVLEAVEEAFREKGMGLASMPPKLILPLPGGDVRAMPAYLKGKGVAGVKVVNSHPGNRARGLPTVMATLILVEPDTGFPIAVIEATHLTSMRTAAAGALAIKLLARDNSEIVALIGAGVQAKYQLMGMGYVLPRVKEVRVWSMEADLAYRLKEDMLGKVKAEIRVCGSPEEAVSGSDIVITATPSKKPIVMDGWMDKGWCSYKRNRRRCPGETGARPLYIEEGQDLLGRLRSGGGIRGGERPLAPGDPKEGGYSGGDLGSHLRTRARTEERGRDNGLLLHRVGHPGYSRCVRSPG